jgi:hypothetical protein
MLTYADEGGAGEYRECISWSAVTSPFFLKKIAKMGFLQTDRKEDERK